MSAGDTPLRLGPVEADAWVEQGVRLCARAFIDYAYVHTIFGEDPLRRLAGTLSEFEAMAGDIPETTMGAWLGGTLVGMAAVEHTCRVCDGPLPVEPTEKDGFEHASWEFDTARREAHRSSPPHAHLVRVAAEPVLHGAGVGGRVVAAALDAYRAVGERPVLLECVRSLEPFYRRLGFAAIGSFDDSLGEELALMIEEAEGSPSV